MPVRHLYLARHAEPGDQGRLTERGVQQAQLLGRRLSAVPLGSVQHGPLPRARETAQVVAAQLGTQVPVVELGAAGDYVPHVPSPDEVDPEHRAGVMAFLAGVSAEEAAQGAALAAEAVRLLTGPGHDDGESHHLVMTHAFTIGWLVRHACAAPPWRWVGLDSGHAALTVLRYFTDRPPAVAVFNDMSHLPPELRWTGFPDHMRL
ncbi:histidine phosphatase family protein [Nocardioides sp. dk4132]|uniref:histidine phosphatase family protein n=1 Tax=unclassified Nocardioides TaxID=2615069 RepID=UPI0012950CDE|nr:MULTISPECIES: histidine phosphatase family protein [unclassified Nocardioides]MQW75309.1 histidine phosphatase family protein [Nocardioides sp. dk4132]QGA07541.1 histidine phosphatase family protein [Nocardioides sp. dk884]